MAWDLIRDGQVIASGFASEQSVKASARLYILSSDYNNNGYSITDGNVVMAPLKQDGRIKWIKQ